jgi:hypothetical protein
MALGQSFLDGGGFLTDVLESARRPIREFVGTLPDLPDPYGQEQSGRFANPFGGPRNSFLDALVPSGLDFVGAVLPGPTARPNAVASAWGQGMPTAPQARPSQAAMSGPIARAQQRAAAAAEGPTTRHSETYSALFTQIAAEEGVPADYLAALADTERSGIAAVSPAGARGMMQVVPGQGYDLPGEDWRDPATSIRQGARALKAKFAATGSWDAAAAAYFGYGTDAGGQTTEGYLRAFQQNLQEIRRRQPPTTPTSQSRPADASYVPSPAPGMRPLKGLTVAQYGSESLATGAADYICGPIAAQAFVRSQGRNPTLQEALDLARALGVIDPTLGMHGIESTATLIRKLGGAATVGAADRQRMAGEIQAGRPVIVNTRLHYFVAEDYDPATGRFDFGNSAASLRASGGRTWYTLEELATLTIGQQAVGPARGAIYAGY